MLNDETRAHAHALLNNSANTAATDPSHAFTRAMSSLTQTTLRDVRPAGGPTDEELQLLACAVILDELAARIACEKNLSGAPRPGEHGAPATATTRDLVLDELQARLPQDGTDVADLTSALIDYTVHRRGQVNRTDDPVYAEVVTRLYRIHDRLHTGTSAECYAALLTATATVINDLITQLAALTDIPTTDVRHSMREYIRSQPHATLV